MPFAFEEGFDLAWRVDESDAEAPVDPGLAQHPPRTYFTAVSADTVFRLSMPSTG